MTRILKLILLCLWIFLCFCPGWVAGRFGKTALRDRLARLCYAGILKIIGVHVSVRGQVSPARPLLLVANHISYLDIFVLGSAFPFRFTPKSEVAAWPGIGALSRATGAVFVDRRPEKMKQSVNDIRATLASGDVVCLFPEATTSNGVTLKPFKSGMFQLAADEGQATMIQPAAIVYTRLRRLPIDHGQWPLIAWYGDMDLAPHLWELLGLGRIDVELIFLPVVSTQEHPDRKAIAARCQKDIWDAVESVRSEVKGRPNQARRSFFASLRSKS